MLWLTVWGTIHEGRKHGRSLWYLVTVQLQLRKGSWWLPQISSTSPLIWDLVLCPWNASPHLSWLLLTQLCNPAKFSQTCPETCSHGDSITHQVNNMKRHSRCIYECVKGEFYLNKMHWQYSITTHLPFCRYESCSTSLSHPFGL